MPPYYTNTRLRHNAFRGPSPEDQGVGRIPVENADSPEMKLQRRYDSLYQQKKAYILFLVVVIAYLTMFAYPSVEPDFETDAFMKNHNITTTREFDRHLYQYKVECLGKTGTLYTLYGIILWVDFINSIIQMCCFSMQSVLGRRGHKRMRQSERIHYVFITIFNLLYAGILIPQCLFYYGKTHQNILECNKMSDEQFSRFYSSLQIIIFLNFLQMPYFLVLTLTNVCFKPKDPMPPEEPPQEQAPAPLNLPPARVVNRRTRYEIQELERYATKEMINDFINNLETVEVQSKFDQTCNICLGDFDNNKVLKMLPCDPMHIFHLDCIKLWFDKKLECPLCRTKFEPIILDKNKEIRN